ncbi:MAG: hypothetical protein F4Y02_06630 [Chloroflexi bacterium]|nr:hypothetical protein [Chloroflexota bacterium]
MARRQDHFLLRGGLDLVSSTLAVPNGRLLSVKNYESVESGYGRVGGYERHDGRPAPSDAAYSILNFTDAARRAEAGDTLTGATSGASAVLLTDAVAGGDGESGSYVLGDVTGTFQDDEVLRVGSNGVGTANGTAQRNAAPSLAVHERYALLAANLRRAAIQPVPGSGPVRGVWQYKGDLYTFRDNEDASALDMYKSSPDGWQLITVNRVVHIAGVEATPSAGNQIRGTTSGAIGRVVSLRITGGSISDTTGVGILTYQALSGRIQGAETLEYRTDPTANWQAFAASTTGPAPAPPRRGGGAVAVPHPQFRRPGRRFEDVLRQRVGPGLRMGRQHAVADRDRA